jgi:hypothetical protein
LALKTEGWYQPQPAGQRGLLQPASSSRERSFIADEEERKNSEVEKEGGGAKKMRTSE